jgi:hypothetical protein
MSTSIQDLHGAAHSPVNFGFQHQIVAMDFHRGATPCLSAENQYSAVILPCGFFPLSGLIVQRLNSFVSIRGCISNG